jgi:hypothetical protein
MANPEEGKTWETIFEAYTTTLFDPAFNLVKDYREKYQLGWGSTFSLLATPAGRTSDLNKQVDGVLATPFQCYKDNSRDERLYPLLCAGDPATPDDQSMKLLERPVLADMANEIGQWVVVLAQIADVYDRENQRFYPDVGAIVTAKAAATTGRDMLASTVRVLDVAIAGYNQMYGGVSALAVIDCLESLTSATDQTREALTKKAEVAIGLLKNNPYLAENVATLLLQKHQKHTSAKDYRAPPESLYRDVAFNHTDKGEPGFLLAGLFSDLSFIRNAEGNMALHLTAGAASIDIPLPAPNQFVEGRLVFPPRFYELLNTRSLLVDRLFGYNMLSYVSEDIRDDFAAQIVQ